MGQLKEHGYTLVDSLEDSEICLVNSCTVKNPAESRGLHLATRSFHDDRFAGFSFFVFLFCKRSVFHQRILEKCFTQKVFTIQTSEKTSKRFMRRVCAHAPQ